MVTQSRIAAFNSARREKGSIPELGDNPARRKLHNDFDLGLVAPLPRPCRHDRRVVVRRHLGIGAIDTRLVEAGFGKAGAQIVGYYHRRHATEEGERARMRSNPIGRGLCERRLDVGVARRAEGCDEQLTGMRLPGRAIDNVDGRAGIIDEELLAGYVRLPAI
jgi:hypothetical protein